MNRVAIKTRSFVLGRRSRRPLSTVQEVPEQSFESERSLSVQSLSVQSISVQSNPVPEPYLEEPEPCGDHTWLDFSCVAGIRSLIKLDGYAGIVSEIDHKGRRFCVDESGIYENLHYFQALPPYIATLDNYNESTCRGFMRQLASHLRCLHMNRVVYGQLNLDKVCIVNGTVKLHNLRRITALTPDMDVEGPDHLVPESVYLQAVDVLHLGELMYFLLTGVYPPRGDGYTLENLYEHGILYHIARPSASACRLIEKMLRPDVNNLFTMQHVLDHEWMNEYDKVLETSDLSVAKIILGDWTRRPFSRQ